MVKEKQDYRQRKKDTMQWVEVFKTDVNCAIKATELLEQIAYNFTNCTANFDLEDCDRILRIVSNNSNLEILHFIAWLKKQGCHAEVLPG